MKLYQIRVIDERDQLADRITKLKLFIDTQAFENLPDADQILLSFQLEQMSSYKTTLECRIARFECVDS